jgi:hypothetical protein
MSFKLAFIALILSFQAFAQKPDSVTSICTKIVLQINQQYRVSNEPKSFCTSDNSEVAKKIIDIQDELPACVSRLMDLTPIRNMLVFKK